MELSSRKRSVSAAPSTANPTATTASESILSGQLQSFRERWQRMSFNSKILLFTMVFFSLLCACYSVLLSYDARVYTRQTDAGTHYPEVLRTISEMITRVGAERDATIVFVASQTTANWAALSTARSHTDATLSDAVQHMNAGGDVAVIDNLHPLMQGTRLSELGVGSLNALRSQITRAQVVLPLQGVRVAFTNITARMLQQLTKLSCTYSGVGAPVEPALKAFITTDIGLHLSRAMEAAKVFLANNATAPALRMALKDFAVNMYRVRSLSQYTLLPYQQEPSRVVLDLFSQSSQLGYAIHDLLVAVTANQPYAGLARMEANASFPDYRDELERLVNGGPGGPKNGVIPDAPAADLADYARSIVMVTVAALLVVGACIQWIVVESLNADTNAERARNADVMHDVLVRVGEMVDAMAAFHLDPKPPPRSMMGTRVGVLELRLQHCLASLKALAPALPSLLFPQRLAALAAEYSEVKDPATMQYAKKPRDSLIKEHLQQVTEADIRNNPHSTAMYELTRFQVHNVEAAFLFVDLSSFHNHASTERMQYANETFRDVCALIEECVYQFRGVMHAVALDRAVGAWNLHRPADGKPATATNYCEEAATCALVLSHRLASLRRSNRLVGEYFQVCIGVVAGPVQRGVFGSARSKYLEVFGPPLAMGIKVARANAAHMTTVACDETVRRAVERTFLAKPIELLDEGQRVYEMIHEGSRRGADLESQLLVYSKAFELYEKKYYREALRAFRAYTKVYGYDSSVERIQAIISGM